MLFQKGKTQGSAGTEQYYNAIEEQSFSMVQVEWYQHNKWYTEIRHNYEALNTFSLYMGRSYEKKAALSYFVCPMAALVGGNFTGGSVGLTADITYKKLFCATQAQYTFSVADRSAAYLYNWSELGYQALKDVNTGVLIQQTKPFCLKTTVKSGFYVKWQWGNLTFPLYIFNLTSHTRSLILGVNFQKDADKKQVTDVKL